MSRRIDNVLYGFARASKLSDSSRIDVDAMDTLMEMVQSLTTTRTNSMNRCSGFDVHLYRTAEVPTNSRDGGSSGAAVAMATHEPQEPTEASPPQTPLQSCHAGAATPMLSSKFVYPELPRCGCTQMLSPPPTPPRNVCAGWFSRSQSL